VLPCAGTGSQREYGPSQEELLKSLPLVEAAVSKHRMRLGKDLQKLLGDRTGK